MQDTTLWSPGHEPKPYRVITFDNPLFRLTYLPDGQRVAGEYHGIVHIWDLETGLQDGPPMQHGARVMALEFAVTRDGKKIVSIGVSRDRKGTVKAWDTESRHLVKEWAAGSTGRQLSITISPDDQLIATACKNHIQLDTWDDRKIKSIPVCATVNGLYFSPDGGRLAYITDRHLHLCDVQSGKPILGPLIGHKVYIKDVKWSHDGRQLFSCSHDKTIRRWDAETGEQIGCCWKGHTDSVHSISLSPDGLILASASWDKTVRFWNATTGHLIGQPLRHEGSVWGVCFSPSGDSVASVTWNKGWLWRVPQFTSQTLVGVRSQLDIQPSSSCITHSSDADQLACLDPEASVPAHETLSDEMDLQSLLPNISLRHEERQRIFELRLHRLINLAASHGLCVPPGFILPPYAEKPPLNRPEFATGLDLNMTLTQPSTSILSSTDTPKGRTIDEIKLRLVEMLRQIVFTLPKGRLPWSTLEGDLEKKGFAILNWPQRVVREKDKGISGLRAEDAHTLYDALFGSERPLQFVRHDGDTERRDGEAGVAAGSVLVGDPPSASGPIVPIANQQRRFRITTTEMYEARPRKRRHV